MPKNKNGNTSELGNVGVAVGTTTTLVGDKPQKSVFDTKELGVTGLTRYARAGLIFEEFLPELSPYQARKVYREMRDNDPVIGAVLFAIEMILRTVSWRIEGPDDEVNEFIDSCRDDMSQTWEELLAEVLSMLPYGYSYHEIVYKKRNGDSLDPTQRSKFTDGKIGWRKIPIRSQDSLLMWEFDDDGGVRAFVQLAPPTYMVTPIPIERALLFRTTSHKGNPEGRSIIRNAYRPWYFKRRIEEIEGIGIERDLAGLPVFWRTAEIAGSYDEELKKILRNVRRDEQEGLLLPLLRDDNGNKQLEFELLNSGGSRQFDTTGIITRYNQTIATTCLADFVMLGQAARGASGSYALAESKTDIFQLALGSYLKSIASVFNRYAIPRLLQVNNWKVKEMPKLVPGPPERTDLKEVGQFITQMAGAGAPLFPDEELENHLRELAKLPKKPEGQQAVAPGQPGSNVGAPDWFQQALAEAGVKPTEVPAQKPKPGNPIVPGTGSAKKKVPAKGKTPGKTPVLPETSASSAGKKDMGENK